MAQARNRVQTYVCRQCGVSATEPLRGTPRVFCSRECRLAANVVRQRAKYAATHLRVRPGKYTELPYIGRIQTQRRAQLMVRYGLALEDWDAMNEAQQGLCAICKRLETRLGRSGHPLPLSVDHDHDTGLVRGLLCGRCNATLGFFEDPVLFAAATTYLNRFTSSRKVG